MFPRPKFKLGEKVKTNAIYTTYFTIAAIILIDGEIWYEGVMTKPGCFLKFRGHELSKLNDIEKEYV